jgi:4a-hydroxytetrahydrobiopterin dehydratase
METRTSIILLKNSVGRLLGDRGRRPTPQRYVDGMAVLTDDQVDAALPDLNGWQRADGALRRSIKFPAFLDGIDAVRRVAERAEEKDHHPDIDIRWRTVTFALVTHSAGGITEKDVQMAREIDGIVGNP